MAKYMLMFLDDDWEALDANREQIDADIQKWLKDLKAKGVLESIKALGNKKDATTVRRVNGTMKVTDGPFVESKEHVGGFALINAPDRESAVTIAKTWPAGDLELRPIVER